MVTVAMGPGLTAYAGSTDWLSGYTPLPVPPPVDPDIENV
jgi:hypothetical protein